MQQMVEMYPRRWWRGFLLALLGWPAGYLYVGKPVRAVLAFFVVILSWFTIWHGLAGWLATPIGYVCLFAVMFAAYIFVISDVIRLSLKQPMYELKWCNRVWIYLIAIAAPTAFPLLEYAPQLGISRSVRSFTIPAMSMCPTLCPGDYVVADMHAYHRGKVGRGDIVVFNGRNHTGITYTKRVIGIPGDKIQMREGRVEINGKLLPQQLRGSYSLTIPGRTEPTSADQYVEQISADKSYLILNTEDGSFLDSTSLLEVPDGHYFVLGDNRDNSTDSRVSQVGFVANEDIIGRMTFIYFSTDYTRVGRSVDAEVTP